MNQESRNVATTEFSHLLKQLPNFLLYHLKMTDIAQ